MKFEYNNKEYELIVLCTAGSRLYGNSTPESDWDYRGVYIENTDSKCGILGHSESLGGVQHGGKQLRDALVAAGLDLEETDDVELQELNKFCKLSIDNNPNILDTLCHDYTNHEIAIYSNEKGRKLLDNKNLFISSKLKFTFSGYAVSQLKRIKGHNKWINQYPNTDFILKYLDLFFIIKEIDFNWICDNFGGQVAEKITGETPQENIKLDKTMTWEQFETTIDNDVEDFLDPDKDRVANYRVPRLIDYCIPRDLKAKKIDMDYKLSINYLEKTLSGTDTTTIKDFLLNEASFRTFSPSMLAIYTDGKGIFSKEGNLKACDPETIGEFFCLLSIDHMNYKKDKDHVNKMWEWKCKRNEKRSLLEEKFGYDTKHASHLVRLMSSAEEILTTGKYDPIMKGERLNLVNDVRNGKYTYEWIIDYAENLDAKLEESYKTCSVLPKKANIKAVNELILELQRF